MDFNKILYRKALMDPSNYHINLTIISQLRLVL
jgi:hypothetical protein